jgi:predicted NAD/FAD-binding protein
MGEERFDSVIFATHAPQTLAMLADASRRTGILSAVRYQPIRRIAWRSGFSPSGARCGRPGTSWPKPASPASARCVSAICSMPATAAGCQPVIVTLNPLRDPDRSWNTPASSMNTRCSTSRHCRRRPACPAAGQAHSWFAGAWTGYGFHEDGLKSALRVAQDFVPAGWARLD